MPNPTRSMKTIVKTTASCRRINGASEGAVRSAVWDYL
jgi:hypothetical protein